MPAYAHVISLTDEQYTRLHKLLPEDAREHRKFLDTFIDSALSQSETLRALLGNHLSDYIKTTDYAKYGDILRENDRVTNEFDQEQIRNKQTNSRIDFNVDRLNELIAEAKKKEESSIDLKDYEFAVTDEMVHFRKTSMATDFWPEVIPDDLFDVLNKTLNGHGYDIDEIQSNIYVISPTLAPEYMMTDGELSDVLKLIGLRHVEIDGSEPSSP